MKLYVRESEQKEYHQQLYNCPSVSTKSEIKPGDTLYSLTSSYHVNKVEYSKSNLTVYATRMPFVEGEN